MWQNGLTRPMLLDPSGVSEEIQFSHLLTIRVGHAPVFGDAHRCASDAPDAHITRANFVLFLPCFFVYYAHTDFVFRIASAYARQSA